MTGVIETIALIGASVGGGGAAAGAATAGAVATTAGLTAGQIAAAGTVVSALGAISALGAQAQAADAASRVEEENARQARIAASSAAQDADFEAAAVLADLQVRQSASGLVVSSPSFLRRQNRNSISADINRERIVEDGERSATSAQNRALSQRSSASAARSERIFTAIGGAIQTRADLIGDAELVSRARENKNTIRRINIP